MTNDPSRRIAARDALRDAFGPEELKDLLFALGVRLEDVAAPAEHPAVVREVVEWFERRGRLDELLRAAGRARPGSAALVELARTARRGRRMPHDRNPLFVGRAAELAEVAAALETEGGAAVLCGVGGVGKTQVAIEFAHRSRERFRGGVFWLSFADPAGLTSELAACGGPGALDIQGFDAVPFPERPDAVLRALRERPDTLLIFDNCEDEGLLAEWREQVKPCRVLATTRRPRWRAVLGVREVEVRTFPRETSVELLRRHLRGRGAGPGGRDEGGGQGGDAVLGEIAGELGDLALALHLAGSYLETYADDPVLGNPADFLRELRGERLLGHPALRGEDVARSPTGHALHVGRTFALSYERLDRADPLGALALGLLARASCCAPGEPIPRPLLLGAQGVDPEDREAVKEAARAFNLLRDVGLAAVGQDGAVTLHRLIAAFVQQTEPEDALAAALAAVEGAIFDEAARINKAGLPAAMDPLLPHLSHATDAAMVREDERAARLCNELGYYSRMIGRYATARPYYERALAINEQVLGLEHPDTATSLNNLGALLQDQGDLVGARPYYERALAIREQVLGPKHPDTALSLNNLGALLRVQGDLVGARPYYERALAIREQVLGPEHPNTALSLNNLGALLHAQGDLSGARVYLERALAIREQVLGPEHPNTALSLNNLGALLHAQGDLVGARAYYERALAIFEAALGPDHPNTSTVRGNLAALEDALRRQGEAPRGWLGRLLGRLGGGGSAS